MDSQQIKQALGTPSYEGEFLGGLFVNYNKIRPKVDLVIKLDKAGKVNQFIRFLPCRSKEAFEPCGNTEVIEQQFRFITGKAML
ncbi:hypothetical protein ACLBWS_10705 [Brucellaceae bacterium D45D]